MTYGKRGTAGISVVVTVFALLLAVLVVPVRAQGPAGSVDIQFELSGNQVPFFNKLPYISHLFVNQQTDGGVCSEEISTCTAADCTSQTHAAQLTCNQLCLPQAAGSADVLFCATCPANCCATGGDAAASQQALTERLIEALCATSRLEAALEAHREFNDERQELLSSVMETAAENAELRAKLQVAEHREQVQERLFQSLAENARLKAELEVAQHKQHLTEQFASGMMENQRLKMELAKVESLHHGAPPAKAAKAKANKVRTARKAAATSSSIQSP